MMSCGDNLLKERTLVYKENLRKGNTIIVAIAAVYLAFLLFVLCVYGYTPTNDGDGYIEFALKCIENNELYPCNAILDHADFIWNIGQINLIASSLALFKSFYPVLVLMCILKALTALYIAKTALHLFNTRVAIIVIVLYVIYPNNWGQSTTLLSEIPATFFFVLALYLMLVGKRRWTFIIAGVSLCISNYVRSTAIILIIALAIYYLVFERKHLLKRFVPMMAGYLLLLLIIGAESSSRTGHFIFQGNTLWYNVCFEAYDGANNSPHFGEDRYIKGTPRYIDNIEDLTCFERESIWKERCLTWITNHKMEWLSKVPFRIVYMYFSDIDNMVFCLPDKSRAENNYITFPYRTIHKEIGNLTIPQYYVLLSLIFYYLLMMAMLLGILCLVKYKQWKPLTLLLLIIAIGTISITLVIHAETRFKAIFMPYIFMLAAVGVNNSLTFANRK